MKYQTRRLDHQFLQHGLIAGLGLLVVMASTMSAEAKIRCEGQFQIVKGHGSISTPYCEDNYLTNIARTYGWKVSARSVRHNPNLKARICRQIGHDNRLIGICAGHRPGNDHNRWPL